nr:TBC1 domain family member 8B isoform X5 [Ziziphus jujuba var. spinosa]
MLLSLLSKRSLEVDSRDAYGFALRPQHIQTYRQYADIFKEEEEERSDRWKNFLEQLSTSAQPCSPGEEDKEVLHADATQEGVETIPERLGEGNDSSDKQSISDGSSASDHKREVQQTWAHIRLSLGAIEDMMSSRVKKRTQNMEHEQIPMGEVHLPSIEEEGSSNASEKDFEVEVCLNALNDRVNEETVENAVGDGVSNSVNVAVVEETVCDGFSDSVDAKENSMGDSVSDSVDAAVVEKTVGGSASDIVDADVVGKTLGDGVSNSVDTAVVEKTMGGNVSDSVDATSRPEQAVGDMVADCVNAKGEEKAVADRFNDTVNVAGAEKAVDDGFTSKPCFPWREELECLVRGGVPKDLRGEVWQAFVGVKARRVERYYHDLLAHTGESKDDDSSGVPRKWKRQIEKDIPRTFPGHPALDENGRNSLRRLLLAYARHNPSVGYCQAMNFFAGILLLLMPEENAFWALVGLIDDYFDGYYTEEMIESQVDQLVFEELMRERFPKLVNHLDYLGVQVAWLSGPWFLSIFVNMLPWESVLRVWDVLLYEGNRVMLFRTALALMELYGPVLVTTKDAGDAITLLQSLAGSTFDSSQLVLTACMGFIGVTEARLQELRDKHRSAVLMVVEERSKRGRVWKDSKGLASKLYSFKHDRGSLAEEKKTTEGSDVLAKGDESHSEPHSSNLDDLLDSLTIDPEVDSLPDLQEQVVWMKVELCRLLEEKRSAVMRAEELETALMEMVKEDNRRELSARIEQLELEVSELQQTLADKKEQEAAMLKVLMRVEHEQKVTEDARISAEQIAAAQKYEVHVLQEKYEKAMASVAEMEKRVVMAESMLEATLQYQSGQVKAQSSPRGTRNQGPTNENPKRTGLLSFGLGWRDRNKGESKSTNGHDESKSTNESGESKSTSDSGETKQTSEGNQ